MPESARQRGREAVTLGPVMMDIAGPALSARERDQVAHPLVGGVILFERNYETPEQLTALTTELHGLGHEPRIVAVDQEGGRIQRFRAGFTPLPAPRRLGAVWDQQPEWACVLAQHAGYVMASELVARGVDLSFAPVLDLDYGRCGVIGNRSFHREPHAVAELAAAFASGMRAAGMAAVGKHFPGHGWVEADSHVALPVDERDVAAIRAADLMPYRALIGKGLAGIMPAHVVYPARDSVPAGYSPTWLQSTLRDELDFHGVIFSDDLSMAGAVAAGTPTERATLALDAGCDMVLLCNDPASLPLLLEGLEGRAVDTQAGERIAALRARHRPVACLRHPDYIAARAALLDPGSLAVP